MNAAPLSQVPPPNSAPAFGPGREVGGLDGEPQVNVREYLSLIWVRRWTVLAVTALTVVVTVAWTLTRPRLFKASADISVGERTPQLIQNQVDFGPNYWELERYVDEQVRVLTTRRMAGQVATRLGLAGRDAGAGLLASLQVQRVKDTNIIQLSMVGTDPERAAEWLNVYIEEYIAANIEDNLDRARKVYEVISSRLDPLRDQLAKAEEELMTFREREDALLFADQDKNVITEQVNTLTTEYAQAKAERIRLETKINTLASLSAADLAETAPAEVLQDVTVQKLRDQRDELQGVLADKLRTLREGHPEVKETRSRLVETERRLEDQIGTIRRSLQTQFDIVRRREQSLFDNIQQLKSQSIELSKQTMEYERLRRDYDQSKGFLEQMLARSKEVDITSTATVNNVRVIEPAAAPRRHFTPNLQRNVSMGLLLGLFLGVGLVLGLDYLDHTLRTPEQVERFVGLEALSLLPRLTEDNERLVRESFLTLRTALMMASRAEGCQIMMVTSAVPGEGKTTAVLELGKVLTTGGARVLLIDADLRKPRLHRLVSSANQVGLTSVVLGECGLEEALRQVKDVPGLRIVTSGPIPPNPPEMFGKPSFRALLDRVRGEYDWVVIDTPPVASVTDPVICAGLVDMALMVVQYGGPRRQIVQDAVRHLARTGVRIAGVLFNKVDLVREQYYYYSSYSYYRYGYYRYGEEETGGRKRKKGATGGGREHTRVRKQSEVDGSPAPPPANGDQPRA